MKLRHILFAMCALSVAGVLFSGYLTAVELSSGDAGCSGTEILGLPVCVYGLMMYVALLALSLAALRLDARK